MSTILTLREKRAKAWDSAKSFLDSKRDDSGILSAEDTATYERMEADVVNLGKEIERLERQASIDAELAKPTNMPITNAPNLSHNHGMGPSANKSGRAGNEYNTAFWNAVRNKHTAEVHNALRVGEDADGGYLVPDEFERTLIMALQEENIMRGLATIISTSSGERKIPVVASHGTAAWVEEEKKIPESDEEFAMVNLGAHKVATTIKISDELINDSAGDFQKPPKQKLKHDIIMRGEEYGTTSNVWSTNATRKTIQHGRPAGKNKRNYRLGNVSQTNRR